ncbi:GGDEF domain-containing protein [Mycoplana sp. MJR14]|uniref:GGDEF domain-containing protein n=1 Tax=Mycoplana sp. MJR14 TaxID=3032583 RepID=UPI000DD58867|nr:GGDEF domain-containing protein [Mycoplana sp. MJR14]MDF1635452.1 GGDEF domain-containing protein [Mycoplana sp. MJR14]
MEFKNLILFFVEALVYFAFMVTLLHQRHRIGIGVFITALGVMHFLETYLAAVFYVQLPFGVLSPGSSILFSGKLMMILLLYLKEDAGIVRAPIYGLLAGNFLTVILAIVLQYHETVSVVPGRVVDLSFIDEMGWLMLWGTTLLYIDALAIILIYERLGRPKRLPIWPRLFISGAVVLTFDQVGFFTVLHILNDAPMSVLWGGWIAKMLATVVFATLTTCYLGLARISAIPVSSRPIADIFNDLTFRERYEDLLDRSGRDALTGLLDRSRLEYEGPRLLQACVTAGSVTSLMVVDADHFKTINDDFGHLAGDQVLRAVAATLQQGVRTGDRVYRFGGEEFVVLCEGLAHGEAVARAEQIRRSVEEQIVRPDGRPVTVSIGVSSSEHDGATLIALLSAADLRLYAAKRGGRNRVIGREVSDADVRTVDDFA